MLRSGDIRNQVAKMAEFLVFGPPNFGRGCHKFLTEFHKSGSPSNMWQGALKIRRQKKNKEINDSSKTKWLAL